MINVKKTWETGNSTPSKNDKNCVEIGQPKVGKSFIEIARPHLQTSEITYQSMIKQFFFVHTSWSSIYPTDNKTSQSSHDDVVMGTLKYICWLYLSSSETRYHLTFLTGIFTTNNNSGNRQRSFEIWFWCPALVISSEKCAEKAVQNYLKRNDVPISVQLGLNILGCASWILHESAYPTLGNELVFEESLSQCLVLYCLRRYLFMTFIVRI